MPWVFQSQCLITSRRIRDVGLNWTILRYLKLKLYHHKICASSLVIATELRSWQGLCSISSLFYVWEERRHRNPWQLEGTLRPRRDANASMALPDSMRARGMKGETQRNWSEICLIEKIHQEGDWESWRWLYRFSCLKGLLDSPFK